MSIAVAENPATETRVYRAFGLRIASDIPLPELRADDAPQASGADSADIDLRIVRRPALSQPTADLNAITFGDRRADLYWPAVGRFVIDGPGRIEVQPGPGVNDDLIAFPLLGPVLATALHFRGLFLLHASAVAIHGRQAVVLLGDKGAGKSTTAAALCRAGHSMLADDIVAIGGSPDAPAVLPAWSQMKLSSEAAEKLAPGSAVTRPHVHDAIDKLRILIPDEMPQAPVPLARVYLLRREEGLARPESRPVGTTAALSLAMRYSYMARFGRAALGGRAGQAHFGQAARLGSQVTMAELALPAGIDRLQDLGAMVERDISAPPRP